MYRQKLSEIIEKGFQSEADVKHFLTEVRLFIERFDETERKNYETLKFYADWVLHIKKDNLSGVLEYFKECDVRLNKYEILPDRDEFNDFVEEFTSFGELKNQLKELLDGHSISPCFPDEDRTWRDFIKYLSKLILRKPIDLKKLQKPDRRRNMVYFVIDDKAPIMVDIPGALYWALYIDTSPIPLMGVIPESVGLK